MSNSQLPCLSAFCGRTLSSKPPVACCCPSAMVSSRLTSVEFVGCVRRHPGQSVEGGHETGLHYRIGEFRLQKAEKLHCRKLATKSWE